MEPNAALTQELPGPSSIPPKTIQKKAPKRPRTETAPDVKTSNRPKKQTTTSTKWSKATIRKIATKNQKEHLKSNTRFPKGDEANKGRKTKQSIPLSFNEKAKQAAIRQSMVASARRLQSVTSDTETNRSFLIFNTPTPQPTSIHIYNIDAEPPIEKKFKIITSNNQKDFMETSSLSPKTDNPNLIASTSLHHDNTTNTTEEMTFNKSTDKLDEKINARNEEKNDTSTPNCQQLPKIIYLDSPNSPNKGSDIEEIHTETINNTVPAKTNNQEQTRQDENILQTEHKIPYNTTKQETKNITANFQLHEENIKSPSSSLTYKTPPSSPPPDTISDLVDEDIRALNEIQ